MAPAKKNTKRTLVQTEEVANTDTKLTKGKNDSSFPERCGKRLKSTQITITAGPEKEAFSIHQNVANQSPVLAEWCSKALGLEVNLPDENPHNIGHLLEYLYASNFTALSDDEKFVRAKGERKASDELCEIYALAEKYQLPGLQNCLVDKFGVLAQIQSGPEFFETAKKMYGQILQSDTIYRGYFIGAIENDLEDFRMEDEVYKWIEEHADQDGRLSKDLFTAQRNVFVAQKKEWTAANTKLKKDYEYANGEVNKGNRALGKLRDHHYEEHSHDCDWNE